MLLNLNTLLTFLAVLFNFNFVWNRSYFAPNFRQSFSKSYQFLVGYISLLEQLALLKYLTPIRNSIH